MGCGNAPNEVCSGSQRGTNSGKGKYGLMPSRIARAKNLALNEVFLINRCGRK
jgi:hypothetical protein